MYTVAKIWIYQCIIQGDISVFLFKYGWHLYDNPVDLDTLLLIGLLHVLRCWPLTIVEVGCGGGGGGGIIKIGFLS